MTTTSITNSTDQSVSLTEPIKDMKEHKKSHLKCFRDTDFDKENIPLPDSPVYMRPKSSIKRIPLGEIKLKETSEKPAYIITSSIVADKENRSTITQRKPTAGLKSQRKMVCMR